MKLEEAYQIAEKVKKQLEPYCDRIQIAGSLRRGKTEVKDIEIVAIPTDRFQIGLIVNKWKKIRGDVGGKYLQRELPGGINLDLFFATERNWGFIFAIRTGSAEYSHKVLGAGWVKAGYKAIKGMLTKNGKDIEVKEEENLFKLIGIDYVKPELRGLNFSSNKGMELKLNPIPSQLDNKNNGLGTKPLNEGI